MARVDPNSRLDTNDRLKAEYRSAYVVSFVDRARRAGVPADALDYADPEAWYVTLVLNISLLARGLDPRHLTGWRRVREIEEAETMIGMGLDQYAGITGDAADELTPKMGRLFRLNQEREDHAHAA